MAIGRWLSLVFMVYIQQQISSFSANLSVQMSQKPWFWYLWASCHLSILPSPRSAQFLTLNPSVWPSSILFWTPDQNSIWLTELLTIIISDQTSFQITKPGQLKFSQENSIWPPEFRPIRPPKKNSKKIPQQHTFYKNTPREPPSTPPTFHQYFTPTNTPSTLLTPNPYHICDITVHLCGHTGPTVLVLKAVSHFWVQCRMQSCTQSCAGFKKRSLPYQLIYPGARVR